MPYILFFFPLMILLFLIGVFEVWSRISNYLYKTTKLDYEQSGFIGGLIVLFLFGVVGSTVSWLLAL